MTVIHLRTHPDSAPAKPMECGDTSKPASLYDIPPLGQYAEGEVCAECIAKRRERSVGISRLR